MPSAELPLDDDACYLALKSRDARFDGLFFTGVTSTLAAPSVVLVTARRPVDGLWQALAAQGIPATRAGDCYGPGTIAAAVHSGRKFAENFGNPPQDFLEMPFRREVTELS